MQTRRIVLYLVLSVLVSLVGCFGGAGGSSSTPIVKDVPGISSTISGFMSSVAAKDPAVAGQYFASPVAQSQSTVHTLIVYDFGADINDPKDNGHTAFTVNQEDIVQPTESNATVKAYYNLSNGNPLWITFVLVKENGVWMIETVSLGNPDYSGPTNFQIATYFPVTPGASYKYAPFYNNVLQTGTTDSAFGSSPTAVDGKDFYLFTQSSSLAANRKSLRASGGPPFLDSAYATIGYSQQSDGLWSYSPSVNGGIPYKLLEAYHSFNSDHSFTVSWVDASNNSISGTCDIHIGSPTSFETGLQTYSAVPLTFMTTYTSGGVQTIQKWVSWFAPGVGNVGNDEYVLYTDTTPDYTERLLEKTVNGVTAHNLPVITNGILADVVTGSPMSPVTFGVSGGTAPYSWMLANSSLPSSEFNFSATGVLSGTPATTGTYSFDVSLKDKYGRTHQKTFSLTVKVPTSPPVPPTTGYSVLSSGVDTVALGGHYEKFYYVNPSSATTITNVSILSYSPTQSLYTPWAGYDTYMSEWMLSFMPESAGTFVFNIEVTTADGQVHRLTHNLTVTSAAVSMK